MCGKKVEPEFQTIIRDGTEIAGTITASGTMEVNGRVEGRIEHNGRLIIGPRSLCVCDIRCNVLEVAGEVQGEIRVQSRLEIMATGRVSGRVRCGSLVIHRGGSLNGPIQTNAAAQAAAPEDGSAVMAAPLPSPVEHADRPGAAPGTGGAVIAFHGVVASRSDERVPPDALTG